MNTNMTQSIRSDNRRGRVKAAVMLRPGHVEVKEFHRPKLDNGAILLKISLSGICGTDKHTFRGETIQYAGTAHERGSRFPLICGHENVGIIEEIGGASQIFDSNGHPLNVGDRVIPAPNITCGKCYFCRNHFPYHFCENLEDYGNSLWAGETPYLLGGWSEYMYVLPGTILFRVPDTLEDSVAVLTEEMAVTNGLDQARVIHQLQGQSAVGGVALVYGSGPLGLCHVVKARWLGYSKIIALDLMQSRLDMARELGADLVLNVSETDDRQRMAAVQDATSGLGADVVAHCTGVPQPLTECIGLARMGGVVIEAGAFVDLGPIPVNPNADICAKNITIIGVGGETARSYIPALELMTRNPGALPLNRIVTHKMALSQAEDAIRIAQSPESIKVVMDPTLS